jgi:hypothetical protein
LNPNGLGVDAVKEMNAYCLTSRVDGVTEILLSKSRTKMTFEKRSSNCKILAKEFFVVPVDDTGNVTEVKGLNKS